MDYKSLGERIRQHRRALNMTQEALGERANVGASMIGHVERGTRVPSLETIVHICEAMKVSLDSMILSAKQDDSCDSYADETTQNAQKLLQMAIKMSAKKQPSSTC